jgi:antitoxin component of MazEF toxin-antitoxin module
MYMVKSAHIAKWGTSLGIHLPKKIVETLDVRDGDKLDFHVQDGVVTLSRNKKPKTIDELFAGYSGDYPAEFIDFGPAVGEEVDL